LKIIDLFAGIGGIRLGFEQAGRELGIPIDCVFTSEWDKFAPVTYKANNGDEEIFGDITQINETKVPAHNILLAGFPCQPFSQAGLKKGFTDTRGTLFFDIERILKKKKPEAILLENVKHFKNHDGGRTLAAILEHLEKIGYKNHSVKVLNAKDFGVPQNRERTFIVAFRNEKIDYSFPKPPKTYVKVGHILESKVDKKYTISDKLWTGHKRRKKEHEEKGNGFGYSLFNHESGYTSTISARYYKDGSEILIDQKRKNPRKLTPRECARLQGYPEDFEIPVSDTQAYRQFGNSVAVPVIRSLARSILYHLK
jgi:DNA (cytosine-5)-methyltransferase 1